MSKPICIAIEGVDCAGKGTAAKRVVKKLKALHPEKCIELVSFPQYDLSSGVTVKKFLNGDYKPIEIKSTTGACNLDGVVNAVYDVNFAASLYAVNRAEYFHLNPPKDDTIYVFDRYVYSNLTHQLGRIFKMVCDVDDVVKEKDPKERDDIITRMFRPIYLTLSNKWINDEYLFTGLPKATTIYLDISLNEAMSRLSQRKTNKHDGGDILETRDNMSAAVDFIRWMRTHVRQRDLVFMNVPYRGLIDDIVGVTEKLIKNEAEEE